MAALVPPRRAFTVGDFRDLGRRYGYAYRLPHTPRHLRDCDDLCVAEGHLDEFSIQRGMTLVASDVTVHHHFESTSTMTPRFSAIVMLDGTADLGIGTAPSLNVRRGKGAVAAYDDVMPMTGHHRAGERMRSINLSLCAPEDAGEDQLSEQIARRMRGGARQLQNWRLPAHLLTAVQGLFSTTRDVPLQAMLREGICLQLLAHALLEGGDEYQGTSLTARDKRLLARVIERLRSAPHVEHRLAGLAEIACMSSSSLRAKFHAAYGVSVFEWLRMHRLELARRLLEEGGSIQEAADRCGYRHAGNFATAFRRHHGISPSALV